MKTLEQILAYDGVAMDGRDATRLAMFVPLADWDKIGVQLNAGVDPATVEVLPLTRENVLAQLEHDLAFAFEKALNRRGISASLMHDVIKMWLWVLDDELMDFEPYAQYGLPLFKQVAVKYGFANPIGDDDGDEYKYSTEAGY